MLDAELFFRILKKTMSNGGEYADIFLENRRALTIQLEGNKIEKVVAGVDSGVGIRLISGDKTAYAFSNDLSEDSLIELADTMSKTFRGAAADLTLDMRKRRPEVDFIIKMFPEDVPMSEKITLVKTANHVARSFDSRIKQVSAIYRDSTQSVQIATSDGIIAEDKRVYTTAIIQVIASDAGVIQTGYETAGGIIGFELFDETSMEELSLKASKRAVMMLQARRAPGGRMPVVISSEAGGTLIHEAIGHGLEADLAQQGLSIYSNKLGREVASPVITVIDDATIANKRGSYRFDDEGTPSRRNVLVDKGTLTGYMYDRLTAMRDGVKSTGNGRRESYQHRPIPRMTNTFISPGDSSPEDVIKSVPEGLFVRKMGGGQVNTVTGDFVFEVQEGYMIKNGEIGEPVREATLTGNGEEVLRSIDMVASDLGFSIGTCGKDSQGVPVSDGMPTIRIPEIVVGGETLLQ
ncbi:MAG: TldD/PmbA family protein [Thermodesulfovibrionales bacterium]